MSSLILIPSNSGEQRFCFQNDLKKFSKLFANYNKASKSITTSTYSQKITTLPKYSDCHKGEYINNADDFLNKKMASLQLIRGDNLKYFNKVS